MASASLQSLGEFAFLNRLQRRLASKTYPSGVRGPGDDAFTAPWGKTKLVATTDMLVEDVHFRRKWTSLEDLGHKAMAVNLSDLAAMGAVQPRFALLSMGLPKEMRSSEAEKLVGAVEKSARACGSRLLGGDTVSSKKIVLSITLIGEARSGQLVYRSGAKVGDKLFVTGTFGDAHAGLEILERGKKQDAAAKTLVRRFQRPTPRLNEGRILGVHGLASALLDASDGLIPSLQILCRASGVGARVRLEDVPVSRALTVWAERHGKKAQDYVVAGGEDYELVFSVPRKKVGSIARRLPQARCIGEVVARKNGLRVTHYGKEKDVRHGGFEQFHHK